MADWDAGDEQQELFYAFYLSTRTYRGGTPRGSRTCTGCSEMPGRSTKISVWDTSSVATMEQMFYSADAFNQPLSRWDVTLVTNMGIHVLRR